MTAYDNYLEYSYENNEWADFLLYDYDSDMVQPYYWRKKEDRDDQYIEECIEDVLSMLKRFLSMELCNYEQVPKRYAYLYHNNGEDHRVKIKIEYLDAWLRAHKEKLFNYYKIIIN